MPSDPSPASSSLREHAQGRVIPSAVFVPALLLISLNLRPALSSVAPVLPEIMDTLGLASAAASFLTMVPVLCLGIFGFATPRLAEKLGSERTLILALLVLAVGLGLRGVPATLPLYLGTILVGAGIGIAGVLLPGLVKQNFPGQASRMTGVYTMGLCLGAALAAGLTVPMAGWLGGWWFSLAVWALPAVVAAAFWLPVARQLRVSKTAKPAPVEGLWRSPLAWQVTLFMGLQSSLAYIVFGWLAPIMRERGLDAATAGWVMSVSVVVQAPAALAMPMVLNRCASQSGAAVVVVLMMLTGLLGVLYAPISTVWYWTLPLGVAQGASFALALSLLVLRAPNSQVATHLSGMAQSVGYTIAALGPLLAGVIHDWAGNWSATGPLFIAIAVLAAINGFGAGRARHVQCR